MEFLSLIKKRRSTRAFLPKPVEEEKLRKILEAANLAPSAHNWQSYKIYVVKNQEAKVSLAEAAKGQIFVGEAPVVLVFVSTPDLSYPRSEFYAMQDATIACYQAWLAAVDLSLSAVWVGAFYDEKVAGILNLKENEKPVAILPIGYAGEEPEKTERKSLEELVVEI